MQRKQGLSATLNPEAFRSPLGGPFEWEFKNRLWFCLFGLRFHLERCDRDYLLASGAIEVFIQREECVWFEFPEGFSQFLFDAIDLMEKGSTVDI